MHRIGGLTELCRVYRIAREFGAELWAGTMPESGIGSQAAIAAAALSGFVYPSDVEPSARWFGPGADVIELKMTPDGYMRVPREPIHRLIDWERLRPLLHGESEPVSKISREHTVVTPVPGLVMIAGGKFTTWRRMAKMATAICTAPQKSVSQCETRR